MKLSCVPLVLCVLAFASCKKNPDRNMYRYQVTGTAGDYSVTYNNKDGSTEQISSVASGWDYEFKDPDASRFVYISAQNNTASGSVSVKIFYEGKVIKTGTSDGAYVIATASR